MARRVPLWLFAMVAGPLVLVIRTRQAIGDNSYLWHRVAGRIQLETGAVLTEDPFSFITLGDRWRTQSWLADILYHQLYRWFGLDSARWVPVWVGTVTFIVLAVIVARRSGVGIGFGLWSGMTAIITLPFLNPRPVVFSYLMLALVVLLVTRPRLYWAIPLAIWMWAALHGSFPLGFVVIGLAALEKRNQEIVRAGVASLAVVNFTAHGWAIWEILLAFGGSREALDLIQEWQTPSIVSLPLIWFAFGVMAAAIGGSRVGRPIPALVWLTSWTLFGLTSNRAVPLAWIALSPLIGVGIGRLASLRKSELRIGGMVAGVGIVVLATLPLMLIPKTEGVDRDRFPVDAVASLTDERVYHDDATGSWIIHTRWPGQLDYVDDRAELYGEHFVDFVQTNAGLPGWQEELDEHGVTQALVRNDRPIADLLRLSGWTETFRDETFAVLDRP